VVTDKAVKFTHTSTKLGSPEGAYWLHLDSAVVTRHPAASPAVHSVSQTSALPSSTAGLVGRAIWQKFRHADSRSNVVRCLPDCTAASAKTLHYSSAEIIKLVCRKLLRFYCLCNNVHIETAHNAEGADVRYMAHIPHVSDVRYMAHILHVSDVRYMVHIPHVSDVRYMVHIPHVSDVRYMIHIPHVSDVRSLPCQIPFCSTCTSNELHDSFLKTTLSHHDKYQQL